MTSTLPVGRGLKQSLKKYSPALLNVCVADSPGARRKLNKPFEELRRAMRIDVVGWVGKRHRRSDRHAQVCRRHAVDRGRLRRANRVRRRVVRASENDGVVDHASFDRRTRDRPADHGRRRSRSGRQRSADLERPEVVTARRRVAIGNAGAAGVNRDVLLAVDLVGDGAGADRRSCLESPQLVAIARIEREEIPVGLSDEQQV